MAGRRLQHASAEASRNKLQTRQRLREAGLRGPDFGVIASEHELAAWSDRGPVVVKPATLSGSRGVIRADTPAALRGAWARVSRLLAQTDIRALRDPDDPVRQAMADVLAERRPFTVQLLYGDQNGGQRTITRFAVLPHTGMYR